MVSFTQHTRRRGRLGLVLAVIAAALATSVSPAAAGTGRAIGCAVRAGDVMTENTCYRWSHAGELSPAAAERAACAGIVSENSCYRWAHSGEAAQALPLKSQRLSGTCATRAGDVLTENSCYRFSHRGEATSTAVPSVPRARTSSGGVDWTSTGIGAAGAFGLMLLGAGFLVARRRALRSAH